MVYYIFIIDIEFLWFLSTTVSNRFSSNLDLFTYLTSPYHYNQSTVLANATASISSVESLPPNIVATGCIYTCDIMEIICLHNYN